jgi:hypothetical protein
MRPLGEDSHHGGGGTLAAKTALVSRLIDECGFSAVVFEASLAARRTHSTTASPWLRHGPRSSMGCSCCARSTH